MTEDIGEIFAVVCEFKGEAPILMEAEGRTTSLCAARDRMRSLVGSGNVVRAAVVRLTYESGNELLMHDMKRMQR